MLSSGFDVRFSYDSTKINPSDIETNEITTDSKKYFKWEDEFKNSLDLFTINYDGNGDGIRAIISFDPPVNVSEHIKEKTDTGKYVDTGGGVLLGKMSFQMTGDEFNTNWFSLTESSSKSPKTGIKINIDGTHNYQAQSTFRFTDNLSSDDDTLTDLQISSGKNDETDHEKSDYKKYELTPSFDKENLNYKLVINDYIDKINVNAKLSDEKAKMKIKYPKRTENGDLINDSGGKLEYIENDLTNNEDFEVKLNELGKEDTIITIETTAENGKNRKQYIVTIHRPFATIKGNIYTAPTAGLGTYESDIRIYNSSDTENVVDWINVKDDTTMLASCHENLLKLKSQDYKTNSDGTYEIYVLPGTYDILFDKQGYLDCIYRSRTLVEGNTLDLGKTELLAGDLNKDGIIDISDSSFIKVQYLLENTDETYIKYSFYDFNKDGIIDVSDSSYIKYNYLDEIEIK